jgi:predicted acetylornithine/succinylornithine family transaminase
VETDVATPGPSPQQAAEIARFDRYVIGSIARQALVLVRGAGSTVWDGDGRAYLDFYAGRGTANLGHCHPAVVMAVHRHADRLLHVGNDFYSRPQGELAERLVRASFDGQVFFSNSGAEANETALKLARRHGTLTGRGGEAIVAVTRGFHGRTMGALSATGTDSYRDGFEPLVPGFRHVELNDLGALEGALEPGVGGMIVELVQGEAGVYPANSEWIRRARELCSKHDIALIFDEVQTAIGRCGPLFAYQRYGVTPDVMTLAKSLAGGVPIGATVIATRLCSVLGPGTHASTFGGAPLACAAALAVLDVLEHSDLLERASAAAEYLDARLSDLASACAPVVEVRGVGLMRAIELRDDLADELTRRCRERHALLIAKTGPRTLRLLPALIVTNGEIDLAIGALEEELATFEHHAPRPEQGTQ